MRENSTRTPNFLILGSREKAVQLIEPEMEVGAIYYWVGRGSWQGNKQKGNGCGVEDNESNSGHL